MCIAVKYERKFNGNKGWKLLRRDLDGKYQTGMIPGVREITITKNKWADAGDGEIEGGKCDVWKDNTWFYPAGFHIFTKKSDAECILNYLKDDDIYLCRVEFQGQKVYGEVNWKWKNSCTTVVAKYCMLLKVMQRR